MAGGIAGRDSSLVSAGITHPHPGRTPNILGLLNPRLSMGLALPAGKRLEVAVRQFVARAVGGMRVSTRAGARLPSSEEKCLLTAAAL